MGQLDRRGQTLFVTTAFTAHGQAGSTRASSEILALELAALG